MAFPFARSIASWFSAPTASPSTASEAARHSPDLPGGTLHTRAMPPRAQPLGLDAAAPSRWAGVSPHDPAGGTLTGRARYMAANSAPVAAGVDAWAARAVGAGITPTPQPPDADLGARIAERFDRWSERCDLDGVGDFYACQDRTLRACVIDGNALVETPIVDGELRVRTRSIDQLAASMNRTLANGFIDRGIQYDNAGRKVGFHLYKDTLSYSTVFVPVEQMCHVYRARVPGELYGTTWLSSILLPARENDQLRDALLVSAKVAAMHCGFLIDMNAVGGVPYEGPQTGGLLNASLEPGVMRVLPSGIDVKFNNPQQANSAIELAKLTLRQIASGLGVPAHLIDYDLSQVNYSSLRGSLLDFKRRVEQVQFFMLIPMILNPVYRKWLAVEIATGRIPVPDGDPEAWMKVAWLPPAFEMVDPQKDMAAEIAAIDAGLKSRRQAVAERGYNVEQLDREIAADRAREAELGLSFGTTTNTGDTNA